MMITLLYVLLTFIASCYLLYVFYAAVMNIQRVYEADLLNTMVGKALAYPTLIIGYTLDVFVNFVVCTVVFVELPKELTVTRRLRRHKNEKDYRGWIARTLEPILDPLDPSGTHIRKRT